MQRALIGVLAVGALVAGVVLLSSGRQETGDRTASSADPEVSVPTGTTATGAPVTARVVQKLPTNPQAKVVEPSESIRERAKKLARYTPDPDDDRALVGLSYSGITDAERTELKVPDRFGRGVIITKIHPDAPAVGAGLAINDVIVRAQRTSVDDVQDLETAVGERKHTVLTVSRDGNLFHVVLHKPFVRKAKTGP